MIDEIVEQETQSLLDAAHGEVQAAISQRCAGRNLAASFLSPPKGTGDEVIKVLVRHANGKPLALMHISPPAAPDMVANCMKKMAAIRKSIGPRLGEVILKPLARGDIQGRTYAIVPYCTPLQDAVRGARRLVIGPLVLRWLRDSIAAKRSLATDDEIENEVVTPLNHLSRLPQIDVRWRKLIREAITRVDKGRWRPALAIEHGDLWLGNVLLLPNSSRLNLLRRLPRPFTLVDWYGARLRTPGIFDLVRFANSMRLSPAALKRQLRRHCDAGHLDCSESDAIACLAASLGHIAMHLGHFPMEKFARMAESCLRSLAEAIDAS